MKETSNLPLRDCKQLSLEELATLEESLEVMLPEDYRSFLLSYGSCTFRGLASLKTKAGDDFVIQVMFGKTEARDILEDYRQHPDYVKNRLIPIASDLFDNRYVLNGESGEIGFVEYDQIGQASYVIVAPSFSRFIRSIKVDSDI